MTEVPFTLHFLATDAQLADVRTKLGIPAAETSGKYSTSQADLAFRVVSGGADVDVLALKGLARFASQDTVRMHIAEQVGL